MSAPVPRPFVPGDADEVLQLTLRSYTPDSRWYVGDVAWHLGSSGGRGLGDHTYVWSSSHGIVAVSWWDDVDVDDEQRAVLTFVGPTELLPDIVEHCRHTLDDDVAAVDVVMLAVERDVAAALRALGFEEVHGDVFFVNLQCALTGDRTGDPTGDLTGSHNGVTNVGGATGPHSWPEGVSVSRADEHPAAAWVAVHRAVWPDSTLTVAEREATTRTWPYDARFDLVAATPDGTVVGYVTGWLPPGGSTGQLEPVGTLPDWRRRGVSRALGRAVLAAFTEAGATRALVYARGDAAHPAARATYESLGFREHAPQHRWQLRLR